MDRVIELIYAGHDCSDLLNSRPVVKNIRDRRAAQLQQQQQLQAQQANLAAESNQVGILKTLNDLAQAG